MIFRRYQYFLIRGNNFSSRRDEKHSRLGFFNKNLRRHFFLSFSFAPKQDALYQSFIKSFLDFIIAFLAILFLLPVFITVALVLTIANRGTPFFFQVRPGKNERLFRIIKFKTMNNKKDDQGELLSDEERLTPVGKFIRKTSLDEIPQLINILKGDMSLVGPRPLLPQYLSLYSTRHRKRHAVKPGITGWAQVNGRNAISWGQKFEYDVWYVEHQSFWLDLKILWKTVLKVINSEGINSENMATTEPFKGE